MQCACRSKRQLYGTKTKNDLLENYHVESAKPADFGETRAFVYRGWGGAIHTSSVERKKDCLGARVNTGPGCSI